jgi:hypothetical protein
MFEYCIPDQSKLDIRNGVHLSVDDYKIALFLQSEATDKNRSSLIYTPIGEISGTGYTPGGKSLTGFARFVGDKKLSSVQWESTTEGSGADQTLLSALVYHKDVGEVRGDDYKLGVDDIAYIDFDDPTWTNVTFVADAAVVYNASKENKILTTLLFGRTGADRGTFSIQLCENRYFHFIAVTLEGVYGPGGRATGDNGLTFEDRHMLLDSAEGLTIASDKLSPMEKYARLHHINLMRSNLNRGSVHGCDHSTQWCPHGERADRKP